MGIDLKTILESIVKFGVLPVLIVNVWWLNTELQEVKSKLYTCFDDKEEIYLRQGKMNTSKETVTYNTYPLLAVFPSKSKRKNKLYEYN